MRIVVTFNIPTMSNEIEATSADGKVCYQILTPKYLDDACDVIKKTLFTVGKLSEALGVPDDPLALAELEQIPRTAARDGVSVVAIDKSKDKVVGVAFNKLHQPTDTFFKNLKQSFENLRSLKILDFIISTENLCNLFELCQADCLMEIFLLGTLPEYRKQGIGRKLCEISLNVAQNLFEGVNVKQSIDGQELQIEPVPKAVTAIFNSFISQKIGSELGFTMAAKRSNAKMELMGEPLVISNDSSLTMVEFKKLYKR